jgi:hypothetical protein
MPKRRARQKGVVLIALSGVLLLDCSHSDVDVFMAPNAAPQAAPATCNFKLEAKQLCRNVCMYLLI